MQISIVIVNYNVAPFLQQCIESVKAALKGMVGEIIVVDNASADASCEMLKALFPDVKLIANKENLGFGIANNQGVQIATGKYVLILNPDTIIAEDTLTKLFAFAEKNPEYGALGVPLHDGTGKFLPESKRNIPSAWVSLLKLMGNGSRYYAEHLAENESGNIDILVGAFMWMERKKYEEVGGFDEDYFMYGEDIDLGYKLLKKGYNNYYFTQTQVIHYKGESTLKDFKYLKHFHKAMRIFYKKHFKVNVAYDFLMRGGILFWYWVKYFQLKFQKSETKATSGEVLYIGNDTDLLEKLQNYYQPQKIHTFSVCESRVISRFDDLAHIEKILVTNEISEIVFDYNSNSFSKIIFYMLQLSKYNLTYKIHPKNADFIIGSNDKNSRGIVVKI